jgi:hypothetical protein
MLPRRVGRLAVATLVLLSALSLGAPCVNPPSIVLTSPTHGVFTTAASTGVTGQVKNISVSLVTVRVNGVVVPVNPDGTFSTTVTLDPAIVFNGITAEMTRNDNGGRFVKRVVLIVGSSVADGAYSSQAIALRLNDTGLNDVEPIITSGVPLDLATLLPPGTVVIDNYCYATLFGLCIGRVDAIVEPSPPPSIGSYSIDADSQTNSVDADVLLNNLFVRVRVVAVSGVGFTCYVTITAASTDILGNYGLSPDGVDPSNIDVVQNGPVNVVFGGFNDSTDCAGFLGGVVEFFIDLLVGDIQDLIEPEFEDFLADPDGAGPQDAAIAEAIEVALAGISIAGPVGDALDVLLAAPLFQVVEDTAGITLGSNASVTSSVGTGPGQCLPPPGAPDFTASYHVAEAFPSWGATVEDPNNPGNFIPYDLAVGMSTSAFNQLLKAQVECGLLRATLTEIDLGFGAEPITAALLSVIIPQFAFFDPATPLEITLTPTLAPVFTGNAGPGGELEELRIGHLVVEITGPAVVGQQVFLTAAGDARVGLDVTFNNLTSSLSFALSEPAPSDITAVVLVNTIQTNATALQNALPVIMAPLFPSLSDTLGSLPLPSFFGLQLQGIDVTLNGDFLALYADLVPSP